MLEHVLMLESLHHACGCLLIPNFRASLVLPEHQSLVEHCSTDEEITKGQYVAGNGLGSFRGVNVWIRKMRGNYKLYGTWDDSRINLYLLLILLSAFPLPLPPVSPIGRNVRVKWLLPIFSSSSHPGSASRCCRAQTLEAVCSAVSNASSCCCKKHMANRFSCLALWGQIPKQRPARELRHIYLSRC